VSAGLVVVAGEAWNGDDEGPTRGLAVAPIVDEEELADVVSTVDDLDLPEGRVAAVLALAGARDGVVGHYGTGPRADRELPEPPAP
jgi:hypothetical protein